MEALKYLFILDIVVAVSLAIAIIFGLISGVKKNIHRLIVTLIPVILLFIFINPISNKIVNKEMSAEEYRQTVEMLPEDMRGDFESESLEGTYTIKDLINVIVVEKVYDGDQEMKDSKIGELAEALSATIVKIVLYIVFLILILLIELILKIIFAIIRGILHIKLNRTAPILGALVGVVRFAIVFILLYLPLYGFLNMANQITMDMVEYKEELSMSSETVRDIYYMDEQVNKSLVRKIIINPATKMFAKDKSISIDAQYVSNGLSIRTESGETVNLYTEYSNIKKALPVALKIVDMTKTGNGVIKLSDFTKEDIEAAANVFKNSDLLKVGLPAISEYLVFRVKKEHPDLSKYLQIVENLKWDEELNNLSNVILVLKDHLDVEVDTTNVNSILTSDSVIDLANDLIDNLLKMQLVKDVALPIGVIYGVEKLKESLADKGYDIDYDSLKNLDWAANIKSIVDYAFDVYREYVDLNLDVKDLNSILNNAKLPDSVKKVLDKLAEQDLIVDSILPPLMQILTAKLKENDSFKNMDIDYNVIKEMNWRTEIPKISKSASDIIKSYQNLGLNPESFNFEELLKNSKLPTELDNVVDSIMESDLVKELILPVAMGKLIESLANNEGAQSFGFDFDKLRTYDYSVEIVKLKDVFVEFVKGYQGVNFDKDNWSLILDNPDTETYVNNIVDKALLSTIVKDDILPKLSVKLQSLLEGYSGEYNLTVIKDLLTEDSIEKLLTNDVHRLIEIIKNLKSLGIIQGSGESIDYTNPSTQEGIANVIKDIFKLSIVDGKQETTFDGLLNMLNVKDNLTSLGVTIDYSKVTDWDQEIDNLAALFTDVMKFSGDLGNLDFSNLIEDDLEETKKDLLVDIVVKFASSQAMGDSIYDIMNNMLANYDPEYSVTFTPSDKLAIENETGWKKEMETILNVLKKAKEIQGVSDYSDFDVDTITAVINEASEGVIASKIVGKVLSDAFGSTITHDFTTRSGLKDAIPVITAAIKLANISNSDTALDDISNMSQATDAIRDLAAVADQDLANEFLNEIIGETGETYTTEQISDSADIIDDVYSQYEASPDKDNFTLDDLDPTTRDEIEANPLAKALLLMWYEEHSS